MSATFTPGQQVRVSKPNSMSEWALSGQVFKVECIAPNGAVIVGDNWGTHPVSPAALVHHYDAGTKVRICSRTATVLEAPYRPTPHVLVRYHDDGNHCWVNAAIIDEIL